ncbi:MAG: hypothetical protein A3C84_03310 [Candidatus Ryanbacteria bacterium RIFCSPHIGHO2_02_FULL_48_12]|uniref:Uncharacterized protein n=1 Tax=Candidatus Ryanbacteria bacterium RIFCSPHIGHO2_01_FULL_48_27 TaxID=1802115 RepID=A0A1G2G6C4_9BACT|nr:MAG: hypothetical protein A2756_02740 [Candidatus Ryanbacteria bacterium RIFCSPHIGHO2_01_FULL_48_27]OGZ49954.1 MAG: hypothetical protein A3C84_03310 [Candidatus Ryanbacteria bacterium RIFCSPHIGHO2_02_FULL_48_12]
MLNTLSLHPWRWWLLVSRFFRDQFVLEGPERLLRLYTGKLASLQMNVIRGVGEGTERISDALLDAGGDAQSFVNWCLVEIEYSEPKISKGEAEIISRAKARGHAIVPRDAEHLRRYEMSGFHRDNAVKIVLGLLICAREGYVGESLQEYYKERATGLLSEFEFMRVWDLPMTYGLVADVAEFVCDAKRDFLLRPFTEMH